MRPQWRPDLAEAQSVDGGAAVGLTGQSVSAQKKARSFERAFFV
jgi:hypothetical protein